MSLLLYNSADYYRKRDIPRLLWLGLTGLGWWAFKVAWRVLMR